MRDPATRLTAQDVVGFLNQTTRPFITYLFGFTVCWGFAVGRIGVTEFMTIAAGVVTFWFGIPRDQKRSTDNGDHPPAPAAAPPKETTP